MWLINIKEIFITSKYLIQGKVVILLVKLCFCWLSYGDFRGNFMYLRVGWCHMLCTSILGTWVLPWGAVCQSHASLCYCCMCLQTLILCLLSHSGPDPKNLNQRKSVFLRGFGKVWKVSACSQWSNRLSVSLKMATFHFWIIKKAVNLR